MQIAIHHAAANFPHFWIGLNDIDHAPLGIHEIEIQILCQPFKQGHAFDKEGDALVAQIIGPDGHGVSGNIAAAKPPFFQNRDIGDAMIFGKIMGSCKTMPPSPNDQHVIFLGQWRVFPVARPIAMMAERIPGETKGGKLTHQQTPLRPENTK